MTKQKISLKNGTDVTSMIVTMVALLFLGPVVTFGIGFLMGWITKITIGHLIVHAFTAIGLDIGINAIPWIGGLLGWIASFFGQGLKANWEVQK